MTKNTKTILGWCFYDFANSSFTTIVVTFVYSGYFVDGIVASGEAIGQSYWAWGIAISAILIALISPVMGVAADQGGYRKSFLFFWTLVCIIFSFLLFFPQQGDIYTALFLFIIANVAFEIGTVFCNAYVPDISNSNNIGKISGYGYAFGYLGGLLSLVLGLCTIAKPELIGLEQPILGISNENGENFRAMNILVSIWFLLFSIPTFLWIKKDDKKKKINIELIYNSFNHIRTTFKEVKKIKNTFKFLLARLFYNDALITIFAFGGVIAKTIYGFNLTEMLIFGIILGISAGFGAFLMGFIDDRVGPKKIILLSNLALIISSMIVVFIDNETMFWFAGAMVGFWSGPNQSSSRSLMASFSPKNRENEFFGLFALSGKITAFIGPALLGIITIVTKEYFHFSESLAQRSGISIVLLLLIVGTYLLYMVDEKYKPQ